MTFSLGLFLIFFPIFLFLLFRDKLFGFVAVLSTVIVGHIITALLFQSLGIFSYGLYISFFIFLNICLGYFLYKHRRKISPSSVNAPFVAMIILASMFLSFAHFNYDGDVSTIRGPQEASHFSSPYPYYSDEWMAIGFVKQSIETGVLPLENPLWEGQKSPNFWAPFFAAIGSLSLLLSVDPLVSYVWIGLLFNLALLIFAYAFLRALKISSTASAITIIFALLVTNGANLPGLWHFIPINLGLLFFLSMCFFLVKKRHTQALLVFGASLWLYPPMVVFSGIALISYLLFLQLEARKKIKILSVLGIVFILAGTATFIALLFSVGLDLERAMSVVRDNLSPQVFVGGNIPNFHIWYVVPFISIAFFFVGLYMRAKSAPWIWITAGVSLLLWYASLVTPNTLIIGRPRIVFVASFLVILLSGYGIDFVLKKMSRVTVKVISVVAFGCFFIFSFFYTQNNDWQKLVVPLDQYGSQGQAFLSPNPPASQYLIEDDLILFEGIHKKRFIAPQWKGLVIGVATGNYPLHSKESLITNQMLLYGDFFRADCEQKKKYIKKFKIDYVYAESVECDIGPVVGKSQEGLILYKIKIDI